MVYVVMRPKYEQPLSHRVREKAWPHPIPYHHREMVTELHALERCAPTRAAMSRTGPFSAALPVASHWLRSDWGVPIPVRHRDCIAGVIPRPLAGQRACVSSTTCAPERPRVVTLPGGSSWQLDSR